MELIQSYFKIYQAIRFLASQSIHFENIRLQKENFLGCEMLQSSMLCHVSILEQSSFEVLEYFIR